MPRTKAEQEKRKAGRKPGRARSVKFKNRRYTPPKRRMS